MLLNIMSKQCWLQECGCAECFESMACIVLQAGKPECYPSAQQMKLLVEKERQEV